MNIYRTILFSLSLTVSLFGQLQASYNPHLYDYDGAHNMAGVRSVIQLDGSVVESLDGDLVGHGDERCVYVRPLAGTKGTSGRYVYTGVARRNIHPWNMVYSDGTSLYQCATTHDKFTREGAEHRFEIVTYDPSKKLRFRPGITHPSLPAGAYGIRVGDRYTHNNKPYEAWTRASGGESIRIVVPIDGGIPSIPGFIGSHTTVIGQLPKSARNLFAEVSRAKSLVQMPTDFTGEYLYFYGPTGVGKSTAIGTLMTDVIANNRECLYLTNPEAAPNLVLSASGAQSGTTRHTTFEHNGRILYMHRID